MKIKEMEWAEFFTKFGNEVVISEPDGYQITVEDLYLQFENRFVSTHHVESEELLHFTDIVES